MNTTEKIKIIESTFLYLPEGEKENLQTLIDEGNFAQAASCLNSFLDMPEYDKLFSSVQRHAFLNALNRWNLLSGHSPVWSPYGHNDPFKNYRKGLDGKVYVPFRRPCRD